MTTSHPQTDTYFSTCQNETPETGQTLSVTAHFVDGSHDSETALLGDYGNWIPVEEISEAEERLKRVLNLRHVARITGAKS